MQRAATHGLIGMRYRVEADGGSMRLESAPGKGTLIEAILPVTDIDSADAAHGLAGGGAGMSDSSPCRPAGLSAASYGRGVAPPTGPRARTLSPSARLPSDTARVIESPTGNPNPQTRHSTKEPR